MRCHSAYVERRELFDQPIYSQNLFQIRPKLIQRQSTGTIAERGFGVGVSLQKQPGDAHRHAGSRQRRRLCTPAIGTVRTAAGTLKRMGGVENHRSHRLHFIHAQHVDDKVVVAEGSAALAKEDAIVPRFLAFADNVPHFMRGKELRLLDVYDGPGLRDRDHEIGLPGKESRYLDDVGHLGHGLRLMWLMNIGKHGDAEAFLHFSQNFEPLQPGATERVYRGAVRLIEARLENERDVESTCDLNKSFRDRHQDITAFDHVHASDKDKGGIVGERKAVGQGYGMVHETAMVRILRLIAIAMAITAGQYGRQTSKSGIRS